MPNDLTRAEQAAATELYNACQHTGWTAGVGPDSLCAGCDDMARAVVAAVHDIIAHEVLTDASERVFAEGRSKRDAVMAGKSTTSLEYIEGFEDAAERAGLYADRDRAAERQAEGDDRD